MTRCAFSCLVSCLGFLAGEGEGDGDGTGDTPSTSAMQAGVPDRPKAAQVAGPAMPLPVSFALVCAFATAACVIGPYSPSTSACTAVCRTFTAGPVDPTWRWAQVGVTPPPVVATSAPVPCTCWAQAASATSSGSAAHVAASTTPVGLTSWRRCHFLTAAAVIGPNSPSGVACTFCWIVSTAGPTAPTPSVAQVG